MRPLRTYELLKTFNETQMAQHVYMQGFLALVRNDHATWVKMRRRYSIELARFIRGV
jgi:hypothetical protein